MPALHTTGYAAPHTQAAEVRIGVEDAVLSGMLAIPLAARGMVAFAHGSGSSRHSPRNRRVAQTLNEAGLATLLADLLTAEEHALDEANREWRFDIGLLTRRLTGIVDWLSLEPSTRHLPIGLFGASTGAAAALCTAAARPQRVHCVVSRGGRPDLAGQALTAVRAPTLLIVGGLDGIVIGMNRDVAARLSCEHRLEIVPGATHLFEEPGTLERVAALACDWFVRHFPDASAGHRES
jgi:putative phosphoribosyl transferase